MDNKIGIFTEIKISNNVVVRNRNSDRCTSSTKYIIILTSTLSKKSDRLIFDK